MGKTLWRTLHVLALSLLGIFAGIVGGMGALALFGLGSEAAHTSVFYVDTSGVIGSALVVLLGGFMLFVAALSLVFGVGIWTRRPHMWSLGVISQGLLVLLALGEAISGSLTSVQLMSVLVAGVILALLHTPTLQASVIAK